MITHDALQVWRDMLEGALTITPPVLKNKTKTTEKRGKTAQQYPNNTSSLSGTSWRPTQLVWVVAVELHNKVWVQDEWPRDPWPFLSVDQEVIPPPSTSAGAQSKCSNPVEHFWWTNTLADPVVSLALGCYYRLQGAGLRHGCAGEPPENSSMPPEPCGGTPALNHNVLLFTQQVFNRMIPPCKPVPAQGFLLLKRSFSCHFAYLGVLALGDCLCKHLETFLL